MRVLVVDDDADVRTVVRSALGRAGVEVIEASTAAEALAHVSAHPPDLVVLDLHLPDGAGLEVLAAMRVIDASLYVIILTGDGKEVDRVRGLMSGADDYMVKPFSPRELAARVLAVDRRRTDSTPPAITIGDLTIDRGARTVTRAGVPVALPRLELDLLVHFATHPGQTFTRQELLRAVWGSSAEWQKEATVTEHVRRLRLKLERDPMNPELLLTVSRSGYKLVRQATAFDPPGTSTPFENTYDATAIVVGTTIRYASATMVGLLQAGGPNDIVGHDVFEFVAPQSIGAVRARHEQGATGSWPRPERLTMCRVDGSEVAVEISSTPVLWEGEPASQVTFWANDS